MDPFALLLAAAGLVLGIALGALARGGTARLAEERGLRIADLEERLAARELDASRADRRTAEAEARLEAERSISKEKLSLLEDAKSRLSASFQALSAEALRNSNESFLTLAKTSLEKYQEGARTDLAQRERSIAELLAPVRDGLNKLDGQLRELEKAREGAYQALSTHLKSMAEVQGELRTEAQSLVRALRTPQVRGRWGELQLRRVVELAGMLDHCDFHEQLTVTGEEGKLRPDLVVHLPGGRDVVVDSKAPLSAYLDAMEARDDATRAARLADHARQLKDHIAALSRKAYWEQFQPAPELAVLFLPGESFYAAALEADPSLLEAGIERRILLASPTTLIALLKAVAYGWQKEAAAENAEEVAALGRDLYKRLGDLGGHFGRIGKSLAQSVDAYNRAVGSLEARALPAARRFQELTSAPEEVELSELTQVDALPRPLTAPELEEQR